MTMPLSPDADLTNPTEEFQELVRDALHHLYDPARLQTHPLQPAGSAVASGVPRSRLLRQELLDAIEALRPGPGVAASAPAWRVYNILELRYIESLDVSDVLDHIALSKSQYHREHQRALQAIASLLWERRRPSAGVSLPAAVDLARHEAQHLHCADGDTVIDPLETLRGVGRLLEPLCQRLGAALRVEGPARLPAIPGDRVALRQALLTFLTAAVEGSAPGVVAVAATAEAGEIVLVASGVCTPAAVSDWPRAAASRPFVEALRGRLEAPAASTDGHWRARFSFPAVRQDVLMVVDNSTDFIQLVARYVARRGWQVVGVADVTQAALLARRQRPRAVLLDVVLPGRDGWDLLMELKTSQETRAIPVIICSVLNEPSVAISLGAAAYLCKPIDQHRLLETLAALRAG